MRPDILVLGAGGVLGEAWLTGMLAGVEDGSGLDLRGCEYFLGTSAGALVAARLAAGERLRRPSRTPDPGSGPARPDPGQLVAVGTRQVPRRPPSIAAVTRSAIGLAERTVNAATGWGLSVALGASAPVLPAGLALAAPGGAVARAAALRMLPRPAGEFTELRSELDGLAARFDGRLRIVAVARASGRRIVFGRPGAPRATVADAVQASCAVPWLVAPIRIGVVEYVDGGFWSPTNLDVAPAARDTQVLCLSPTAATPFAASRTPAWGSALAAMWPPKSPLSDPDRLTPVARRLSRAVTLVEATSLRGRRAQVGLVAPDDETAAVIGGDLMDAARVEEILSAGYQQGLRL